MALSQGQILNNRYRIVRLLKVGGFGAVYRAWDLNLQRPCAVKENNQTSADSTRQFMKEATILANLSHPNLPRVTDHFIIPNQGQYLVMDFIEGQDLSSLLQANGHPLSIDAVMPWIMQVSDALSYMHAQTQPIIHRDIKPENIKITPDGRAVLVDFGISKVYEPNAPTTSGARAVTPGYSPPEQYGRGATDIRSDIYSFGATIYTLLTNLVPADSVDILRDPSQRSLPVSQVNPSVSTQVSSVIEKAMQIDPRQRFANLSEMKLALTNPNHIHLKDTVVARPIVSNNTPGPNIPPVPIIQNLPISTITKSYTWLWLLLVGIFAIAAISGIIYSINNNTAHPTTEPVITQEPPPGDGEEEVVVPPPPRIQRFDLSRTSVIRGECLEVSWEISGETSEVKINRDNLLIHTSSLSSAVIQDCPTGVGGVLYSLVASGPGGTEIQERQLLIEDVQATEAPVQPEAPQIAVFEITNPAIELGGCTEIFWEIGGSLSESVLYRNNELIDRRSTTQGQVVECPGQSGQFIYKLVAQGPGGSTQNERSLMVKPSEPTSPPPSSNAIQPIAYVVGDPGATDIYLYYQDSNSSKEFVKGLCDSSDPEWSLDGQSILYQSNCPDKNNYDLFLLNVNGGIPLNLTNTPEFDEREPHYSPDGQQIVYQRQAQSSVGASRNNEGEIMMMNRDGSGIRSLGLKGRQPVISPNGRMLAFMARINRIWQISLHDFSSGATNQLTTTESTNSRFPTWSPDSRFIVYSTSIDKIDLDPNGIFKHPVDGGAPIGLIQNEQCGRPDWSESGWIVFSCAPGIEMIREDGSNRTVLVKDQRAFAPVWLR